VKHGVGCLLTWFIFQAPMRGKFRAMMVFSTRVTWVLSMSRAIWLSLFLGLFILVSPLLVFFYTNQLTNIQHPT